LFATETLLRVSERKTQGFAFYCLLFKKEGKSAKEEKYFYIFCNNIRTLALSKVNLC